MKLTLAQLAEKIGAVVVGNAAIAITGVAALEDADATHVSFLSNPHYEKLLASTKAAGVIVGSHVTSDRLTLLKTADPYLAFCKAVVALHGHRRHAHQGVHRLAFVDETAAVGAGTVIYPGAYVGPCAKIGRECILYPNAVVYDDCVLGDRVILHAGVCIGHDGYGYATSQGIHHKIPQTGNVILEDDVEVGANSAIQRAAMGATRIGKGTKVDSLVSIGHGVKIGDHGLLVSQVGIAGSTNIGNHVILGGQVGVAGHLEIGNNVMVAAQGGITNDVPDQAALMGSPAMPVSHARRVYVTFTKLPELLDRIKRLEEQVNELSQSDDTSKG